MIVSLWKQRLSAILKRIVTIAGGNAVTWYCFQRGFVIINGCTTLEHDYTLKGVARCDPKRNRFSILSVGTYIPCGVQE